MEFTAEMIAGFIGGEIVGDKDITVTTIAKIEEGTTGALSFLSNIKYEQYIYTTGASIVIVNRDFEPKSAVKSTLIKVDDAYGCFAKLLELYVANKPRKTGISPQAAIDPSVTFGKDCYVGEFAVIGADARIGNDCRIYPQTWVGDNVTIGDNVTLFPGVRIYDECVIGNNVIINAGSVIGADGFGFAPNTEGGFDKIPQIGIVVIEDDVEIGVNTCIDRATMGYTRIQKGVKLDNLIQIGHNASIGENTVCAAQVGIAGSSKLGANCMLGGQVGVAGHITIGNRVRMASKTGISNDVGDDQIYMGSPGLPVSKFHRSNAVFRNLPELSTDVQTLKKQMKKILNEEK